MVIITSKPILPCFSRVKPFGLTVALDSVNGAAAGDLFWDDGDSIGKYISFCEYIF